MDQYLYKHKASYTKKEEKSIMGILDNLEAYLDFEKDMTYTQEQCFYCNNKSKYTDVAPKDTQSFMNVSVCQEHFVSDVSS